MASMRLLCLIVLVSIVHSVPIEPLRSLSFLGSRYHAKSSLYAVATNLPEQIHVGLGGKGSSMTVSWVTQTDASEASVKYGVSTGVYKIVRTSPGFFFNPDHLPQSGHLFLLRGRIK